MIGHIDDEAAAFVLGALTDEERRAVVEHLANCAACRSVVAGLQQTAELLPLAAPLLEPEASLKRRVLAAAEDEAAGFRALARGARAPTPRMSWQPARAVMWLAAAAAVVMGALIVSDQTVKIAQMKRELAQVEASNAARESQTRHALLAIASTTGTIWHLPGGKGGRFRGSVVQPRGGKPAMLVGEFPQVSSDMVWRVWVIHRGKVHSVGMAHPGMAMVHMPMPVETGDQIAFTMEHPSASAVPGAPYAMMATLD